MRYIRAIIINSEVYPWSGLQDTPAGKEQIANARKFITAIEEAAAKYLPKGSHTLKICEEYTTEVR